MTYKASLDNGARIITAGVTILFITIITLELFYLKQAPLFVVIASSSLLVVIYLLVFLLRPVQYELTAGEVIIRRQAEKVTISRQEIAKAEIPDRQRMGTPVRTFGVGGLFGYFGKFYSSRIGSMTWYATRRDRIILIETIHSRRIIISPDEPEKFLEELNKL